jgi:hypothetical protein
MAMKKAPAKKAAPKKATSKKADPNPRGANQTGGGYIRKYEAAQKKAAPEIKRVYTDSMGQGNPDDFRAKIAGKYMNDNSGYRLEQRVAKRSKQLTAEQNKNVKNFVAKKARQAKQKER